MKTKVLGVIRGIVDMVPVDRYQFTLGGAAIGAACAMSDAGNGNKHPWLTLLLLVFGVVCLVVSKWREDTDRMVTRHIESIMCGRLNNLKEDRDYWKAMADGGNAK